MSGLVQVRAEGGLQPFGAALGRWTTWPAREVSLRRSFEAMQQQQHRAMRGLRGRRMTSPRRSAAQLSRYHHTATLLPGQLRVSWG